jgi:hypothetical protein
MMTQLKIAVIGVIGYCCYQNNMLYCQVSQEEIRSRVKKIYGLEISLRWLNMILSQFEEQGIIERQATKTFLGQGQWRQNRTLYYLKGKGIQLLRWLGTKFYRTFNWLRVKCPSLLSWKRRTGSIEKSAAKGENPKNHPKKEYDESYWPRWKPPEWMQEAIKEGWKL